MKTRPFLLLMLALLMAACTARDEHGDLTISEETIMEPTSELLHKAAPKPHFMTLENFRNTLDSIKERL